MKENSGIKPQQQVSQGSAVEWLSCPKYNDGTNIVEREGYRVRGNRRAVYLGCGEKTAKTKGIVRPAAIQM